MKVYFYRQTHVVMQLKNTYKNVNLTQPNHNCENNNINKYDFIGSLENAAKKNLQQKTSNNLKSTQPNHNCKNNNINKYAL